MRWFLQLHVRLALLAAALMALAGWVLWALSVAHGERSALEASQRLQRNLAADIVKHQPRPLIGDDGRADAELFPVLDVLAVLFKIGRHVVDRRRAAVPADADMILAADLHRVFDLGEDVGGHVLATRREIRHEADAHDAALLRQCL